MVLDLLDPVLLLLLQLIGQLSDHVVLILFLLEDSESLPVLFLPDLLVPHLLLIQHLLLQFLLFLIMSFYFFLSSV